MQFDMQRTVAEIAATVPHASKVFERLGIDYCCNGSRRLSDACVEAGLAVEAVRGELAAEQAETAESFVDWTQQGAPELIEHLLTTHHPYTRDSLARLGGLMRKVLAAHGDAHPELEAIGSALQALHDDLMPHLMKEEHILFPYILTMARQRSMGAPIGAAPFGTVRNPIQMMNREHEGAGDILAELAARTHNYTPPPDACGSWSALYEGMRDLQADLHRHIHLETHVLFPLAVKLERGE